MQEFCVHTHIAISLSFFLLKLFCSLLLTTND
ncbi:MAG: hypothetical protein ACHQM6_07630 [Candidatus Kapaibacterium sp.]